MFSDTVNDAKACANLYSLLQTAMAAGHEPYAYLRHVFTELPEAKAVEDIEALIAWRVNPAVRLPHPSPAT